MAFLASIEPFLPFTIQAGKSRNIRWDLPETVIKMSLNSMCRYLPGCYT